MEANRDYDYYFIFGVTAHNRYFTVDDVDEQNLDNEVKKMYDLINYFGGTVTVYGINVADDIVDIIPQEEKNFLSSSLLAVDNTNRF